MQRMDGVDANFLYLETPTMHMHTVKVAILERPEGSTVSGFDFDSFVDEVVARLDKLPSFRKRALMDPLRLNHPMWISDKELDPARHIFRVAVPPPGTMRELEKVVGQVVSIPLDRSVPLWELHVCEGMAGGRVAVVAKLHHALADGNAANNLLANATGAVSAVTSAPVLERTPSRPELVSAALADAVRQAFSLPALLVRTVRRLVDLVRIRRGSDVSPPRPILDVPRTSFNGPLGSRRNFATVTLSLDELKAARHAHGVTLNDVVLGVVSGALRRWLDAKGERPSSSLTAGVPVGTDPGDGPPRLEGNRVSNMFTTLATDVDDPHERLLTISRVTDAAKLTHRTLGPDMFVDWVQFTPPAAFGAVMRLYSRLRAASWHPAPFNVVVSNVAGPREELRLGDSRLVDLFSVGPILEGIGLNVTAWSYQDRMNVTLLSCPDLVPDLAPLVAEFVPALHELTKETP
ncbi:wax ester/triacylglycerol synthase family O-acyltransferase [Nocardioides sp.]|uniref:WS/DGAT/MGAT family O-acyltransferase n=1 Tax=Nocardioides sp. TaxID=35761 RepID=UPI001A341170|nr:wax ester/triacylglycerol synthase family O-acyltransferase [Nocardioides sp.]MBJ7359184.1 wax ester/triacylglycerol synthase family O-acyltransferase [Nocardioides sp.]